MQRPTYVSSTTELHTIIYRVCRKSEATNSRPKLLIDFPIFFTGTFLCKFTLKRLLKVPSFLACVATLHCKTLMSENQRLTINYKAYFRSGGVANNQIEIGLLLNLSVKELNR